MSDLDQAADSCPKAISSESDLAAAEEKYQLGKVLQEQGRIADAIASYQTAIELNPNLAKAHHNLGHLFQQQGQTETAIASYQTAIRLEPELTLTHYNLGHLFYEQGQREAALASYQTALTIDPGYDQAKLGIAISQLPIIYRDEGEIQRSRDNYQHQLQNLAASYRRATKEEQAQAVTAIGSIQPFYLAYQEKCDRDLQQVYGTMIQQLMASRYPQWSQPLSMPKLRANQKIRVGFVSGFFNHHSVWKIIVQGWVENLDRSEFELYGYHTGKMYDQETARAAQAFDRFEHGSLTVAQWAEKIAQDKLHVLIFPEFAMDIMAIQLGCLKLAPVQLASWGHPETSGLPTIDYFLSSDLMEPENGQSHYTEKLVRLPNLGVCYNLIPIQPKAVSKKDLGMAERDIMYWCCQSLFKYLPQHDDIFPRIAQEVSNARFVFIKLKSEYATEIFCQRLAHAFAKFKLNYQDYCIFLPRMSAEQFAGITAIADIYLDNISWSGGNTTMESTAYNLPIVTLPGELMRSRHTLAILKMMGIEETIAQNKDQYIQIAVRLGQDSAYRQEISQQIALNKHKSYGDVTPVRALENFLLEIVGKPRKFENQEVQAAFQLAEQYYQRHNLRAAEQEYSKVVAVQPDHAEALYSLGTIAQQRGQLAVAEQYFSTAVKAEPDLLKAWFSLGNLRQSQEQFQEAEQAYQQALNLRPDSAPICNNLGYVLQQQNKWSAAAAYYKQALELMPNCVEAEVNWGNALFAQGKLTPEQQARYAELNYQLGLGRQRVGDWQTGEIYFRQAISMQPDLVLAYYGLGLVLQQQKKLSEALTYYGQVLQLNSDFGAAYYNLGKIHQDLGDLLQATVNFKQGLKLINPEYGKAVESAAHSPSFADNFEVPEIPQGEVTIGDYQFPAIPSVSESEDKRPFWSVVIPVVNRPEYFPECLASVLAQWTGNEDMEIIVLDNGSNPPQWEIPDLLGRGIIRYYRFGETISLQENWNTAISLCRGQWIHLLHHDDYVLPGFYAQFQASLATCPDSVGAGFTGYENINEERQVIFSQQHNLLNYRGIVADWCVRLGISCPLSPPSLVIRRAAYEHLGGYKLDLPYTCDWEFYKRVAAFYDWWYEPGILAHYREHANSITIAENIKGASGAAFRRAIEISASYLPIEHRATITAKSLAFYFDWCVNQARIPLNAGNVEGAINLLKEALKMERSPAAIARLSRWLQQESASPLLNQLASSEPTEDAEVTLLLDLARQLLGGAKSNQTLSQKTA